MTPIEAMARAIVTKYYPEVDWEHVKSDPWHPAYQFGMGYARTALIALAECEIPAHIPARAWSMHEPNIPENVVMDVNAMMVDEFRAMLRSIANEHEVSGQPTKPER